MNLNILFFSITVALGAPALLSLDGGQPWMPPTWSSPLGTDEFGRDLLLVSLLATCISLAKGIMLAAIAAGIGLLAGVVVGLSGSDTLKLGLRFFSGVVESVPLVLWVLVSVSVLSDARFLVVVAAFTIAAAPFVAAATAAEFERLQGEPFLETARMLGVSTTQALFRHYLPNAAAVLLPLAIQLLGGAVTVDGAIGILGLGNRLELDLGTVLLRGRENVFAHPQLLVLGLVLFVMLFVAIESARRMVSQRSL